MELLQKGITETKEFQEICDALKSERAIYRDQLSGIKKFIDIVSTVFLFSGFVFLLASFFFSPEITIFHATCLFIISYCVGNSDGDRYEAIIKGMAEDIAHIRVHLEFLNSQSKK